MKRKIITTILNVFGLEYKKKQPQITFDFTDFFHRKVHSNEYYYAVDYKRQYALSVTINVTMSMHEDVPIYLIGDTCIDNAINDTPITKEVFESKYQETIDYLQAIKIHQLK